MQGKDLQVRLWTTQLTGCVRKPDVCKNVLAQVFTSTRWYELLIIAINMLRSTMSEAAWYSVNRIAVHIWIKLWSLNTARLSNVIMSKLAHISVTMVSIRLKIKVLKIFVSPQIQTLKQDLEAFSSCFDKVKLWPNSFGVIRGVIRESVVGNPSSWIRRLPFIPKTLPIDAAKVIAAFAGVAFH